MSAFFLRINFFTTLIALSHFCCSWKVLTLSVKEELEIQHYIESIFHIALLHIRKLFFRYANRT